MKLFAFRPSPNASKVLALIGELSGLDIEVVDLDLMAGEQNRQAYLDLNPNAKMPLLVDGDYVLWESNAIMQYLCSKDPHQKLWPADPAAQANVSKWQCWQLAHWSPACGTLISQRVLRPMAGKDPDPVKIAAAEKDFAKYAGVLDIQLSDGRTWLCGEDLTLADLTVGSPLGYRVPASMPVDGFDNLLAWLARLEARPSVQANAPGFG